MDHLSLIESESLAFLQACLAGDADAAVPGCPGWTVTDLLGHMGVVQRHHGGHLTRGVATPPEGPRPTPPETGLATWFREGTQALLHNLRTTPADAPAWTFGPGPHTVAFWHRRMVHEVVVHRVDAEVARGTATPVPVEVAVDGIGEYLEVFLARRRRREPGPPGQVVVRTDEGSVHEVGEGDVVATVAGPADEVYLALWGRGSLTDLELTGDLAAARDLVNR